MFSMLFRIPIVLGLHLLEVYSRTPRLADGIRLVAWYLVLFADVPSMDWSSHTYCQFYSYIRTASAILKYLGSLLCPKSLLFRTSALSVGSN
jgi:hypothetical protein